MKNSEFLPRIMVVSLILCFSNHSIASDGNWKIKVDASVMHFTSANQHVFKKDLESVYSYPFDPGIQATIHYNLSPEISIGTGIFYQQGRASDYHSYDHFGELGMPIQIHYTPKLNKIRPVVQFGFDLGTYAYDDYYWEHMYDQGVIYYKNRRYLFPDYFFTDCTLGLGFEFGRWKNSSLSCLPFFKYRIYETRDIVETENLFYGIKIGFTFNL
jgi:hypothetical protein